MASASPLPQIIEESNVQKKNLPGRGNGLFATSDLRVKSQVMFVARPLLTVLDTAQLTARCDYCLKSPSDSITPESAEIAMLKRCTGCNVLRFCNRVSLVPVFKRLLKNAHRKIAMSTPCLVALPQIRVQSLCRTASCIANTQSRGFAAVEAA